MKIQTLHSAQADLDACINDLKTQVYIESPKLMIYFASSKFSPQAVAEKMNGLFPATANFGCTTAGEIVTGKMLKNSIVAMLFSGEVIESVHIQMAENVKNSNPVPSMFAKFEKELGRPLSELDLKKHVGLILIDGMSAAEEKVMDTLGNMSNITFVGASAGDDCKFKSTHLFHGSQAKSDAVLLVLLKVKNGFEVLKSQSFFVSSQTLTPTKVDEATRTVYQFNDKPALEAYAEAVGTSVDQAHTFFDSNPLGLIIDGEPFVRSPQRAEGKAMVFFCQIKKGVTHQLLESKNIINATRDDLKPYLDKPGDFSGILNFNCIQRTLELDRKNQADAYGKLFKDIPTLGFSTYGEEYLGHINQTSVMLLLR